MLVESASPIIDAALQQLRGQLLPRAPVRVVLNHVMVSAMRATQEVERELDEVSPWPAMLRRRVGRLIAAAWQS